MADQPPTTPAERCPDCWAPLDQPHELSCQRVSLEQFTAEVDAIVTRQRQLENARVPLKDRIRAVSAALNGGERA